MSRFQRWLLWSSSALTGVTGLVYWWMKYALTPTDPWAVVNHPLQPWVLKAHILVAPVMVFALGLIAADHIWRHYRQGVRAGRRSGLVAMGVFPAMVLTGYLIQAVTHQGWLAALVWTHVGTGLAYLAGLAAHHRVLRRITQRRPVAEAPAEHAKGAAARPATAAP